MEQAFNYAHRRGALILLTRFNTPAAIRKAGADKVSGWLRKQGACAPESESAAIGPLRADYDVLVVLSASDGDRMRARDLCTELDCEKSRLSHQLRRMQRVGLISRELIPDDARSIMVRMLPAGTRRHRKCRTTARGGRPPQLHRSFHTRRARHHRDLNERILRHLATPDGASAEGEAF